MSSETIPTPVKDEAKKAQILQAAFAVFCSYGVRRTSMQDIAERAGMSRAALYLHYKSKDDILRSLLQGYYDTVAAEVRNALASADTPTAALKAAFSVMAGENFAVLMESPHGPELLDSKYTVGADITQAGEAAMVAIYADWLRDWAARGAIDPAMMNGDPEGFAATIKGALYGLTGTDVSFAEFRKHADRIAEVFGAALTPKSAIRDA